MKTKDTKRKTKKEKPYWVTTVTNCTYDYVTSNTPIPNFGQVVSKN